MVASPYTVVGYHVRHFLLGRVVATEIPGWAAEKEEGCEADQSSWGQAKVCDGLSCLYNGTTDDGGILQGTLLPVIMVLNLHMAQEWKKPNEDLAGAVGRGGRGMLRHGGQPAAATMLHATRSLIARFGLLNTKWMWLILRINQKLCRKGNSKKFSSSLTKLT